MYYYNWLFIVCLIVISISKCWVRFCRCFGFCCWFHEVCLRLLFN